MVDGFLLVVGWGSAGFVLREVVLSGVWLLDEDMLREERILGKVTTFVKLHVKILIFKNFILPKL